MNNDVTTNEDQDQSQETKTEEQPKTTEETTVTKQIEKMRKRIDREVGQRKESEDENKKLKEQVKTLTEKLNAPANDDSTENSVENTKLNETLSENEKLKAQLVRRDQMDTVAQQFNKAGVIVPKDVLELVVPSGIDDKQVSKNMKALSTFYDSVVKEIKQSFLKADTPRVTGSDNKPFDKSQLRKIKDPVKRVELIKKHINEFK